MARIEIPRRIILPTGGDVAIKESIKRRDEEISTSINNIATGLGVTDTGYLTTTTGWRDLIGDINVRGTAGVNTPTWAAVTGLGGIFAYRFDAATMNEVWITYHVDHDYKLGTPIYLHTHWLNAAASPNTGDVRWGFEYTVAKGHQQQAFGAPTTVYVTQTCDATRYMHHIAEVSVTDAVPFTNLEPDALILCRIFRDAADGADTCTDAVFLLLADCHYQTNRLATKNKQPNFDE